MKKHLDKFPFTQTEFKTDDDPDIIFATKVKLKPIRKGEEHFTIHFFMIYRGDIEDDLRHLKESDGQSSENVYKDIEEQIIIGGHFYLSSNNYHNPTLYFYTDLNKRTPPREHLSDWMIRFPVIQNFIFEYSSNNSNYKLPEIDEDDFKRITGVK